VQALLSTEMEPLIRISQDELGDPKGNWEVRFWPAPAHADNVRQRAPARRGRAMVGQRRQLVAAAVSDEAMAMRRQRRHPRLGVHNEIRQTAGSR
jgi:hypothetical protein